MAEIKYLIRYWLSADLFKFVSFLYLMPLFVLLFYNFTDNYQSVYNYIKHIENSSFKYIVKGDDASFDFVVTKQNINSNYSEEFSTGGSKYYANSSLSNLFICDDEKLLKNSYFNKKNIISSIGLNDFGDKGYPIFISHDLKYQLDTNCGELLYIDFNYYDDELMNMKTITIPFFVVGILRPSFDINSVLKPRDGIISNACAIVPETEMSRLLSLKNNEFDYVRFTDTVSQNEDYISKEDLIKSLKMYIGMKENRLYFIYGSVSTLFVLIVTVIIEFNFTKKRHINDIKTLKLLGLRNRNVYLLLFYLILSKFLFAFLIAVILSKFILFDTILHLYNDLAFILIACSVFVLLIILTILSLCSFNYINKRYI